MSVPGNAGTTGGSVSVGGDVHPPAVWNQGRGNDLVSGRGPGFFAAVLEGVERPEGPAQKRAAGSTMANMPGKGNGKKGGAGAWRERSERKVRRGEAAVMGPTGAGLGVGAGEGASPETPERPEGA
jgi:hypothetical protein